MIDKIFDLDETLYLLKKKLWILVVVVIAFAGLGYYKSSKMTVSYQATAKIFVGRGENLLDYYSSSEIQYYTEFMNIFNEIIRIDDFMEETLKKHNITNVSPAAVKNSIGFSASENTPIFTVRYGTMQQDGAVEVLTAVCNEFIEQAKVIIPDVKPRILDSAKVYPIYPDKKSVQVKYTLVGFVLGLALILVIDYLDDTVKSKQRLGKILPIPVLGDIPKHERGFKEEKC